MANERLLNICVGNPKSKIANPKSGEVQEWLNWQHWKCCVRETVPWVRIPPSPPESVISCRLSVSRCDQMKRAAGNCSYQAPEVVQSRSCELRQAGNGATVAV